MTTVHECADEPLGNGIEAASGYRAHEGSSFQLVTVLLAGDEFGLRIDRVHEILRYSETRITPIPHSARFIEGVINLRGRLVTVVDLRKRFDFPAGAPGKDGRIVIVVVGSRTIGLIVDAVVEVVRVSSLEVGRMPDLASGVETEFVDGVCGVDRGMVVVIDLDTMFSEEEVAAMRSFAT